jgi:hypothetical protein
VYIAGVWYTLLGIEYDGELLHCDRDFEVITTVRNLRQRRLDL